MQNTPMQNTEPTPVTPTATHEAVRARYGEIARGASSCCAPSCCSPSADGRPDAAMIGYSAEQQAAAPTGADLGLGCGNPQAIADLKPGEVVIDLGSGAGFDCFLASAAVGPTGRVIGVDMTPEMLALAWKNAATGGFGNVEFRQGHIEAMPVADQTADVVISNCVVNLSPDKPAVYREAFRVLKPGGRVAIADVLASETLTDEERRDVGLLTGCIAGAAPVEDVRAALVAAGFEDVVIREKPGSAELIQSWAPGHPLALKVLSATVEARRPALARS